MHEIAQIADASLRLRIAPEAIAQMEKSRDVVRRATQAHLPVYGINTGFGKLCEVRIPEEDLAQLQVNLVRSHACGVGAPLAEAETRVMLALRANTLALGYSGARPAVAETLVAMLNRGVLPRIPSKGSVGASGDLAPLAHLALCVIGEGEAFYRGELLPAREALDRAGIEPLRLEAKEGLALLNGTQALTATGALALYRASRLAGLADVAGAMTLQALLGTPVAFDQRIHAARPHTGQGVVAGRLRALLAASDVMPERRTTPARVQDAYSLRCMPQVHGAVRGALQFAIHTVEIETGSATDNPLVFPGSGPEAGDVLSGGNFHGAPLALAFDSAAIALTTLCSIAERRIDRLVNPDLNQGLPAFLSAHPGLASGFMLPHVTAVALLNECKVLAHPASTDNVPTSGGQEDHVSMGMTAALKLRTIVENGEYIAAIELMAAAEALRYRVAFDPGPELRRVLQAVRAVAPPLTADRPLSAESKIWSAPSVRAASTNGRSPKPFRHLQEYCNESRYRDPRPARHCAALPRLDQEAALRMLHNNLDPEVAEDPAHFIVYGGTGRAALYADILINVTSFFRDPEVFDALKDSVFPALIQDRPPDAPIRIWVPGCSTGEEVYSLAIAFLEFLNESDGESQLQIFGTDIDNTAIDRARSGRYTAHDLENVSPERLARYFVKTDSGYQIQKSIRDRCTFAKQNLIKDPPFSHLDLVSCRNVLIYLGPVLQKKIIPIFHFALKPGGYLVLGKSEAISAFQEMFNLVDKKHKVYLKKDLPGRLPLRFSLEAYAERESLPLQAIAPEDTPTGLDLAKEADRIILARFAPAGVVVDENLKILQFRGHTGPFLEPMAGEASLNLLRMVREGLRAEVGAALHQAIKGGTPVRKAGLKSDYNGRALEVDVEVFPVSPSAFKEHYYLVIFEDVTPAATPETEPAPAKPRGRKATAKDERLSDLEHELAATKEYLQATIEEQEATLEELKSTNEEIMSSNEELQSLNEEMEAAREELQSANEELATVNEELENRNLELTQVNDDLVNLLGSINLPILFLDQHLRIRRFNAMAKDVLHLIPADVGRPIGDIKTGLEHRGL